MPRCLLLLAFLLLPTLAHAQQPLDLIPMEARTLEPGRAFVKIVQGFIDAEEFRDFEGSLTPFDTTVSGTPYRDRSLYLYGEIGLAPQLTLVGLLPYRRITVRDATVDPEVGREGADLGSAMIGLRVGLEEAVGLDDRSALAASVALGLPLGYRRNMAPAVGSGQVDAQLLVSYGRSFEPLPLYARASAGYRYRTGIYELSRVVACPGGEADEGEPLCLPAGGIETRYSDAWLLNLEAGYTFFDRVLLQGLLDVRWSVDDPEPVPTPFMQPETVPQQRYVRTGLGLTLRLFGDTGLSLQAFTLPYARNTLAARQYFVGIETRL